MLWVVRTQPWEHIRVWRCLGAIRRPLRNVSWPSTNLLVYQGIVDQGKVEIVGFIRGTSSKKGEDGYVGRQGYGHSSPVLIGGDPLWKMALRLYYVKLFDQFGDEIQRERLHLMKKKVPLHHNKALSLTSAIALVKLVEFGYELLLQPPFPTDLTPCNFFLFPNLKNFLSGQIFESNGSRKRIYHAG